MAVVAGILTTANAQAEDQVGEWQAGVLVRNNRGVDCGSVLFPVLTKLGIEEADSHQYNWFERNPTRVNFYSSAAGASDAVALSFDDGAGNAVFGLISNGTVLRNVRTSEYVVVTADPTTAAVSVTRGALGTTAAAVLDNDLWALVTKGSGEDGSIRRAAYEEPESIYNYLQRFDETVRVSDLFAGERLRTDAKGPLRGRRLQALERVCKDIEFALFDGHRAAQDTANGKMYLTGGIRNAIDLAGLTDNISTGGGDAGIALDDFKDWLEQPMLNGTLNKLAYCGPAAYSAISRLANSAEAGFRIQGPTERVWGMHIQEIATPFGNIDLCMHPLFKDSKAHYGSMYVVDFGLMVQKVMQKLDLYGDCENPEKFGKAENFRAILGLKLKNPAAFGYCADLRKITVS
jgi:hypothetical protein